LLLAPHIDFKGSWLQMEETLLTVRLRDGSENVFKEQSKVGDLLSLIDSVRSVQRLSNERLTELVQQEKTPQATCRQSTAPVDDNNDSTSGSDEDGSS